MLLSKKNSSQFYKTNHSDNLFEYQLSESLNSEISDIVL